MKGQADGKDWLKVMLVEDLVPYLCASELSVGTIYAHSSTAVR